MGSFSSFLSLPEKRLHTLRRCGGGIISEEKGRGAEKKEGQIGPFPGWYFYFDWHAAFDFPQKRLGKTKRAKKCLWKKRYTRSNLYPKPLIFLVRVCWFCCIFSKEYFFTVPRHSIRFRPDEQNSNMCLSCHKKWHGAIKNIPSFPTRQPFYSPSPSAPLSNILLPIFIPPPPPFHILAFSSQSPSYSSHQFSVAQKIPKFEFPLILMYGCYARRAKVFPRKKRRKRKVAESSLFSLFFLFPSAQKWQVSDVKIHLPSSSSSLLSSLLLSLPLWLEGWKGREAKGDLFHMEILGLYHLTSATASSSFSPLSSSVPRTAEWRIGKRHRERESGEYKVMRSE